MSGQRIQLRGTTWDHTRGFLPMVATGQRFGELHPEIEITWEKRSLKSFEDQPVEQLAAQYDLIVLDHPAVSRAARKQALVALEVCLPPEFLADQAANSVGGSHESYRFDDHQWAVAIDAATPVAFWREDLMQRHGLPVPSGWSEMLALARSGHVEVPAAPINCLMNFYALCLAGGAQPFGSTEAVAPRPAALTAFLQLAELLAACDPGCWSRNPIASHDLVASAGNSRLAYCPLAYGYSNYARAGYAAHRLTFGEPPALNGRPLVTTLGGAGLAIARHCRHPGAAAAYVQFVADPVTQRTLYAAAGGQPGHRAAWLDTATNRETNHYFQTTLPVLDRAFVRPHYPGYLRFQDEAGPILQDALRAPAQAAHALDRIDALYRASLTLKSHVA